MKVAVSAGAAERGHMPYGKAGHGIRKGNGHRQHDSFRRGAGEYFQRDGQEDPPDGGGRDHCPGGKGPL